MLNFASPEGIAIVAALIVVVLVVITFLRGIKIAKPDEAIIVTSRQRGRRTGEEADENAGQRVVFGSRVFVKPIVEAHFKLSLRSRQLNVQATAQTRDAITIRVNAVAVVKVGGSEAMVRAAAQRFLDQQDEIEASTEEVLSGSVRSIVGQLTVTEIITNRSALQGQVLEAVRDSLDVQGLQIDTLQIKEIDDDNGYIRDLGRAEAARVKQVAEIAEAVARQASEEARIAAEQAVAESQRKLDLRRAEIQKETDRARRGGGRGSPRRGDRASGGRRPAGGHCEQAGRPPEAGARRRDPSRRRRGRVCGSGTRGGRGGVGARRCQRGARCPQGRRGGG